jgi:hypothetical protein
MKRPRPEAHYADLREARDPQVWCAGFRHRMPLSERNREEPCPKCAKERGEAPCFSP